MGTSNSNIGPKNHSPLLPPWAPEPPVTPPETSDADDTQDDIPTDEVNNDVNKKDIPVFDDLPKARRRLTAYTKNRNKQSFNNAISSYVKSYGGARKVSKTAISGIAAGGRFAGFLSDISRQGFNETLGNLGLERYEGESLDFILAKIADVIAPSGATNEEAAAREAIIDALEYIYDTYELEDKELTALENLQKEDMESVLKEYVSSYIFNRWLHELGLKIEASATSTREIVEIEKEAQEYIREAVKLDFTQKDILKTNFNSNEGRQLMNNIFEEAYLLIEDL